MKIRTETGLLWFLALASLHICPAADISKLLSEGAKLSENAAGRLEEQLRKKPDRVDDRIKLIAYWTNQPVESGRERILEDRARHIFWLIQYAPRNSVFKNNQSRIYAAGPLGDAAAVEKGRSLWTEALKSAPGDAEIRENAAEWLRLANPETAARLFEPVATPRALGYFYGESVLGITAYDFRTHAPLESSEERRQSAFARRALELVEQAQDANLVSGAAFALGQLGGELYADGRMNWDYTSTLKQWIAKTHALEPALLEPYALTADLPRRGERPPAVLRVGGSVMQKSLIRQFQVPPVYPPVAKNAGIQGTARFDVLVGTDGKIVRMVVVSGPEELVRAAAAAVRNWRYEPVMLNGRPCFVLTKIDVNFTLSR